MSMKRVIASTLVVGFMSITPIASANTIAHSSGSKGGPGLYAETKAPAPDSAATPLSALGETPGPGPTYGSRVFIYVNGSGLRANYAEVGWRGSYEKVGNVCGGSVEIQWTDAQGRHKSKSGGINNCTTPPQVNYPGHYLTFDMSRESFKSGTSVCGRYHMDFGTSPWACVTMKP